MLSTIDLVYCSVGQLSIAVPWTRGEGSIWVRCVWASLVGGHAHSHSMGPLSIFNLVGKLGGVPPRTRIKKICRGSTKILVFSLVGPLAF